MAPPLRCSLAAAVAMCLLISGAYSYYVPGTYPQEFYPGGTISAQVNSLTSFETDLPYEYYSMPFCKPVEGVHRAGNAANLGTVIMGIKLLNSQYNFTIMRQEKGKDACAPKGFYGPLDGKDVKKLQMLITQKYRINMVLDNLPVTAQDLLDKNQEFVRPGFELGYEEDGKFYVFNHLQFNILVHPTHGEYMRARQGFKDAAVLDNIDARRMLLSRKQLLAAGASEAALGGSSSGRQLAADEKKADDKEKKDDPATPDQMYMIVGFEVSPCSIKRTAGKPIEDIMCDNIDRVPTPQEVKEGEKIMYTYDVYWQVSDIKWASRWDSYLRMPGGKVHWFSIMNSLLIVLVMATLVAMILIRTVRRDLAKYEQLVVDGSADMKDEAGWKLLTGDAFRAPAGGKSLAVHFGSGVQMLLVSLVTLLLATLGFLSPASRGALLTTTIILFVLLSFVAGGSAVALWGVMERTYEGWVGVALHVSLFLPGLVMLIFTVLNIALKHTGSLGAVPAGIYFTIVAIWFLVSVPLTFVGGFMATRLPILDYPVKTNQIPRQIPPAPLVAHPVLLFFSAGILPFGTMFIELYFAMTSLWLGYFYYLFGFVFLIGLLTIIINCEIAVLCTYVQLCAEDYMWWWQSFYRGGSVAFYVALYAVGFMGSSLHSLSGFLPMLTYLSYMSIMILGLYTAMGTVGFLASFVFVYQIFAAVKQD
uniref:Transmembrane 9 superfamily member n=1 Tax=Tetradesmus obliquus TaxID=3088 RepID=A0A383W4V4_TETOB|eukprot:jgi/Sobl393_1/1524/SZX72250.1